MQNSGVLLIGHGTRDEQGTAEFLALMDAVRRQLQPRPVEVCFLELRQPDIAVGVARLLASGVQRIVVAPVLLFAAGHAKRDIPAAVEAALESQRISWCQAEVLDCHPLLVQCSQWRFDAALGEAGVPDDRPDSQAAARDALILIGRGSSDPDAVAALERFAALRRRSIPTWHVQPAFVAVAEPKVEAVARALASAPRDKFVRIVLQPHLLFHGELMRELTVLANRLREEFAGQTWLITEHLAAGATPEDARIQALITAVCDRIHAAGQLDATTDKIA